MKTLHAPSQDPALSLPIESPADSLIAVSIQTEETRFFCVSMLSEATLQELHAQYMIDHNQEVLLHKLRALIADLDVDQNRFDIWSAHAAVINMGKSKR